MKYKIKDSVKIEFNEGELMIVDMETGFVGKGNQCAYDVLNFLRKECTQEELIENMIGKYTESQMDRINKSIPKIIEWSLERELVTAKS